MSIISPTPFSIDLSPIIDHKVTSYSINFQPEVSDTGYLFSTVTGSLSFISWNSREGITKYI